MGFLDKFRRGAELDENGEPKKEEKKNIYPTKMMLLIRVIIAGYLLYLCYDLFNTRQSSSMPLWELILILTLFIVCSIYIIANSIYLYVNGMYEGGKADIEEQERQKEEKEEIEENVSSDDTMKDTEDNNQNM